MCIHIWRARYNELGFTNIPVGLLKIIGAISTVAIHIQDTRCTSTAFDFLLVWFREFEWYTASQRIMSDTKPAPPAAGDNRFTTTITLAAPTGTPDVNTFYVFTNSPVPGTHPSVGVRYIYSN